MNIKPTLLNIIKFETLLCDLQIKLLLSIRYLVHRVFWGSFQGNFWKCFSIKI